MISNIFKLCLVTITILTIAHSQGANPPPQTEQNVVLQLFRLFLQLLSMRLSSNLHHQLSSNLHHQLSKPTYSKISYKEDSTLKFLHSSIIKNIKRFLKNINLLMNNTKLITIYPQIIMNNIQIRFLMNYSMNRTTKN